MLFPRFLNEAREHQRRLPRERRALHVDAERDQFLPHAGVERDSWRCVRRHLGARRNKTHCRDRCPDAAPGHTSSQGSQFIAGPRSGAQAMVGDVLRDFGEDAVELVDAFGE